MMDINRLNTIVSNNYQTKLNHKWIYNNTSLVFDYAFKHQLIAVEYNSISNKIIFFLRNNQNEDISFYSYILNNLGFQIQATSGFYPCESLNDIQIAQTLISTLITLDTFFIEANKKNLDLTKIQANKDIFHTISGNIIDTDNNAISSPILNPNSQCIVNFRGENNKLIIHPQNNTHNLKFEFTGSNATIVIDENMQLFGTIVINQNASLHFKKNTTSTTAIYCSLSPNTNVSIGEDCMFASRTEIRTDDGHPIYDVETKQRVNPSKDITIGNHVWIGNGAYIFGGANVGSGSVVGANTIVKKSFPNNCVIAGAPAKIVRKNIAWERPYLPKEPENVDQLMTQDERIAQTSYWQMTEENKS